MGNGETFSRIFTTQGTFEYWCNIHGSVMRGRVVVQAAQQTPMPTPAPTPPTGITGSPTPTVAAPAAVPGTGGQPADNTGDGWLAILAITGGALVLAGGLTYARRRRPVR